MHAVRRAVVEHARAPCSFKTNSLAPSVRAGGGVGGDGVVWARGEGGTRGATVHHEDGELRHIKVDRLGPVLQPRRQAVRREPTEPCRVACATRCFGPGALLGSLVVHSDSLYTRTHARTPAHIPSSPTARAHALHMPRNARAGPRTQRRPPRGGPQCMPAGGRTDGSEGWAHSQGSACWRPTGHSQEGRATKLAGGYISAAAASWGRGRRVRARARACERAMRRAGAGRWCSPRRGRRAGGRKRGTRVLVAGRGGGGRGTFVDHR
jgi:hypothetical protein